MTAPSSVGVPELSIQLVALDLDGTILEDGSLIRPEAINAMASGRDRGVRFVTASGRPLEFQLKVLRHFDLDEGAFSALICDERDLYVYRGRGAGSTAFAPILSWNEPTHSRWEKLARKAFDWVKWSLAQACRQGWPARLHYTWEETASRGLGVVRFESETHAAEVAQLLGARLQADCPELACNRNRRLVQVHDARVDKASSLAALAEALGVEPRRVLAIGDSDNDRTMVDGSLGFRSATVANATPSVKSVVERAHGAIAGEPAGAGVAALLGELLQIR